MGKKLFEMISFAAMLEKTEQTAIIELTVCSGSEVFAFHAQSGAGDRSVAAFLKRGLNSI